MVKIEKQKINLAFKLRILINKKIFLLSNIIQIIYILAISLQLIY